jgi:hypothetical protein
MSTGVIIAIVAAVVIAIGIIANRNRLKSEYEDALKGTDKVKALKAGRAYYSALRSGKLTIYDEQAITNDISTMKTYAKTSIEKHTNNSVLDKLERLGQLKAQGVLTEDEFDKQKQKLLNEQ